LGGIAATIALVVSSSDEMRRAPYQIFVSDECGRLIDVSITFPARLLAWM
jgi:hypothetical protein